MNNAQRQLDQTFEGDPLICHYFQTRSDFHEIHASSSEAHLSHKIAHSCKAMITEMAKSIGLSAPRGLSVLTSSQKLHVFSVVSDQETSDDDPFFGITTALHVKTRDVVSKIEHALRK